MNGPCACQGPPTLLAMIQEYANLWRVLSNVCCRAGESGTGETRGDGPERAVSGLRSPRWPLGMTAGPPLPLSSGAEVLLPGTEADGVADAMIKALITLIEFGLRWEIVLDAMRFKSLSPDTPWEIVGTANMKGKAVVSRGLLSMPQASLVSKLEQDSHLRRQLEHLHTANTTEDTITQIRYGYQVLELEKSKGNGYVPAANFRHVRNAVSHPELNDCKAKAFFKQYLGVDYPDLHNPKHMAFLAKQCKLLMEEAIRLCEQAIQKFQKFW
jgi:hypothetical protein